MDGRSQVAQRRLGDIRMDLHKCRLSLRNPDLRSNLFSRCPHDIVSVEHNCYIFPMHVSILITPNTLYFNISDISGTVDMLLDSRKTVCHRICTIYLIINKLTAICQAQKSTNTSTYMYNKLLSGTSLYL